MIKHLDQKLPVWLSRITGGLIAATLVFAPLAFGAVEPWAVSVLAVLAYTALAAAMVRAVMMRYSRQLLNRFVACALIAVALLVVQVLPWPGELLTRASPSTTALASVTSAGNPWNTPSLYPHATRRALLRLSVYLALFVATAAYVRSSKQVTFLASVLVGVGFLVALTGIMHYLSGTRLLYWWRPGPSRPFGPFVSRNQAAAYLSVVLFTGLGLLIARGARAAGSVERWWKQVGRESARRSHQNLLIGFAVSVMGAGVIWSLSRGGIVSMLLGFAGVMLALRIGGFVKTKGIYVAMALMVTVGWATYLGWEPVIERFEKLDRVIIEPDTEWRWIMTRDAARIGAEFPLLGAGAGTFRSVYPYYNTLPAYTMPSNPHNEYAAVFAETGIPGIILLIMVMALLYGRILRGLLVRKNPYVCGMLAGGFGMMLALSLHSVVDFPFRSPAIAATVAIVAAILYRAAGFENGGRRSEESGRGRAGNLNMACAAAVIAGVIWLPACHVALNPLRGQIEMARIRRAGEQITERTKNVPDFVDAKERAIQGHSPADAHLYAALADMAWEATRLVSGPRDQLALADRAIDLRLKAAALEPTSASHHFVLAVRYAVFGRMDLAAQHGDLACDLRPNDPWTPAYLAETLLGYGRRNLAARYLDRAEALAEKRDLDRARNIIARVRREMERERSS